MKSSTQILHEVEAAAQFVQNGGEVPDVVRQGADFFVSLAELPDDEIVPNYYLTLPESGPAAVTVETMSEFYLAFWALGRVHGFPMDASKVDGSVYHELAHLDASKELGFRVLRYGFLITESAPGNTYSCRPFHAFAEPKRPITKLEIALGLAAPARLEDIDSLRLRLMGYPGERTEVIERVAASSNPLLSSMRLPSGFSRSSTGLRR